MRHVDFYKNLFSDDGAPKCWEQTKFNFNPICEADREWMARSISEMEVKKAIFSIGGDKAPGEDGYTAFFFQKCWDEVAQEVCCMIREVWEGSFDLSQINKTLLVLIPKIDKSEFVSQFMPISLCNVIYKCVTKIVVSRLKGALPGLISPFQVSFVPGRHIQDNVVVAKEVFHTMRRMKGKSSFFAIKIDLEKAYDIMKWNFLEEVLKEANFPEVICGIIMKCISTVKTSIIWNGAISQDFSPSRGIRQGDPISPYLFVLGMEKLSHIIVEAVENGGWKPFRVGRRGPLVSHLLFADDLILFGEATIEQARVTKDCLDKFCRMSGQKVNDAKSCIFFSKNVKRDAVKQISDHLGFKVTDDIGMYLGVPSFQNRFRIKSYRYVHDKVKRRLAGWKMHCLSFAGRVTLVNSVINTIPIYPMMVSLLPRNLCNEVERIQRCFIWGHDSEVRKVHMVKWNEMLKKKECGGLNIKKLTVMNKDCLLKMVSRLLGDGGSLWSEVLKFKCNKGKAWSLEVKRVSGDSQLWQDLVKVWKYVRGLSVWNVGDKRKDGVSYR